MKTRFNTYDIVCMVTELQSLIGMRVNQVYDIDNKTYLIRLQRSEEKSVLLLESGNRFHTTQFEWPKSVAPNGFAMKLRKHLKNKRLEKLSQLGTDRVVHLQFGSGEAAYHVVLELYDRGNLLLADHQWTILNVLRPHVEGDKIRFAVKEKYPLDRAKITFEAPKGEALKAILEGCKPGDNLKKVLNPNVEFGPAIIDHVLLENGLSGGMKVSKDPGKGFDPGQHLGALEAALAQAEAMIEAAKSEPPMGYITQKKEERPGAAGAGGAADAPAYLLTSVEFHPRLLAQHRAGPHLQFDSFDRAVDEFFSTLEGQKIDIKTVQMEREAMKKLANVRSDHDRRLTELGRAQAQDRARAELVSRNHALVDAARLAVTAALANQMSWEDIKLLVKTAQDNQDPIASSIKHLKLNTNHITLWLTDPYAESENDGLPPMAVDIDLSLTAFANSRKYYDQKRSAAKKQQKTLDSAGKALKSAERKTKQTLKEAQTISSINKARKNYWFEKFFWFISSDNYLVIGGRDQQQNELLVKRYLRPGDAYVHADVSGAASVVVKSAGPAPPPRTLLEAGHAAVAYSVAWEAKVLIPAWWVHAHQVSKSAPTGEYLTTGSFMIRGKKNFLLPQQLQLGFGFMFRLEDSCIERHKDDRKPIMAEEVASDVTSVQDQEQEDQEIVVSEDEDEGSETEGTKDTENPLATIAEETRELTIKDGENNAEDKEDKEEETEEKASSASEDSSDDDYPDTHIKVDHGTGKVTLESRARTISEISDRSEATVLVEDDKPLSFPSLPKKGKQQNKGKSRTGRQDKKEEPRQNDGPKRGQKSKLKKIKEKYKNQDDEDKFYRMELLKSASEAREAKKALKKSAVKQQRAKAPRVPQPAPLLLELSDEEAPEPELEPEPKDAAGGELQQLCGCPLPEDELLFAVPVVAPYSALNNYKFKVKLTPGTSKRGKAAKTALQVFLRDPAASAREKDLLKAVKEENVARNFPGKVKLSAPNLHRKK